MYRQYRLGNGKKFVIVPISDRFRWRGYINVIKGKTYFANYSVLEIRFGYWRIEYWYNEVIISR